MNPLLNSPLGIGLLTGNGKRRVAPHLLLINEKILRLFNDEFDNLVITLPPRHGKSELVSIDTVFWYLSHRPEHRIILNTYGDSLATHFGRRARDLFEGYRQFTNGLRLDESSQSKGDWTLQGHEGGLRATGAGGAITGRGANLIIIDDIIKNAEEGLSAKHNDNLWSWFESTLRTRKEPNAKEIIIGNRWHKNDFIGRYLKQIHDRTCVVNLPAIAVDNDPLGRASGTALWDWRYSEDALVQIKKDIGSYWWNALYQQNPTDVEGSLFKRHFIKFFNLKTVEGSLYLEYEDNGSHLISADECMWFCTSDLNADAEQSEGDYFVVQTWAYYQGKSFLIDELRERVETLQHEETITQHWIKWQKRSRIVGVERVAYQSSLVKRLQRRGLPIIKLTPETNKVIRAIPAAAAMENGLIYLNSGLHDLEGIIEELCEFPKGEYDDRVDCLTYGQSIIQKYAGGVNISHG